MKKEDEKNSTKSRLWPGNDFNTSVELCYCCQKELINTGSKFSSFYCNDCRELVTDYNRQEGKMSIPFGRHSFMNGIQLTLPYSDEEARQFDNDLKYFFKKVDLIWEWQRLCLFHNLHYLGFRFGNDISIHLYDELLSNLKNDKAGLFQLMVNFITDGMRDDYLKTR